MTQLAKWLLCAPALLMAFSLRATESPEAHQINVSNVFSLGLGTAHRADTYLTPLHYSGVGFSLNYEHFRALKQRPWLWHISTSLSADRTLNDVRNSVMYGVQLEGLVGALRRYPLAKNVEIGVGPSATVDVGALYLSRNGNNPVAANASVMFGIGAIATAPIKLAGWPIKLAYQVNLPVLGAMFAPDYGQLYYEIYLGDRSGLASVAFWGRYFRISQAVTADIKVRNKFLRIGYRGDVLSAKVKGIVSRRVNHEFVVGISTEWLSGLL